MMKFVNVISRKLVNVGQNLDRLGLGHRVRVKVAALALIVLVRLAV